MKIIFICGSLKEGKDGVADYTRRLSGELIRQRSDVRLIAIADKYLNANEVVEETQQDEGTDIPVIRVSYHAKWKERIPVLKAFIDNFDPDWISLQYVPYTFHKKGLPFGLSKKLLKLSSHANWHIMFHEVWIGISRVSPFKDKVVGYAQRLITESVIRRLQIRSITTSNILYQKVLEAAGFSVSILSLFSSLPVAEINTTFVTRILQQLEVDKREDWVLAGIFGHLYPNANLGAALSDLYNLALQEKKQLAFVSFGRMNESGIAEFKQLKAAFGDRIKFLLLGEQSIIQVSHLLQILDYGISCTPVEYIGKSSVYAAMRLHNLKVLLPANRYLPEYDEAIKKYQSILDKRMPHEWSVECIAPQFLKLISSDHNSNQRVAIIQMIQGDSR